MELKLFVYGTLKPGQACYQNYSDNIINARAAIAQGQLFALPAGYPAMVLGEGWVHGFVLSFRDQSIFDQLDEYEGYQVGRDPDHNLYERQLVETFDLTERFSVRTSVSSSAFRLSSTSKPELTVEASVDPLKLTAEAYGDAPRTFGSAWAYLMMPERVYQMGGTWLPSGQWTGATIPLQ